MKILVLGLFVNVGNHILRDAKSKSYDYTAYCFEEVSFTLTLHNFSKEEIKNKVEGILKICGLYPFRNWPIQALSYGQKETNNRICINNKS